MGSTKWDPTQYGKFEQERSQPFYDLLKLIVPHDAMTLVDLGCGTGHLTQVLHQTLKAQSTLGIDSSAEMLRVANTLHTTNLRFEPGDIRAFSAEARYDLVFSNAALQWVPDHERLFKRLKAALKEGGQLAVQVPDNFGYPTHTIAKEVAQEQPFRQHLKDHQEPAVLSLEDYATLLHGLGFKEQLVRAQIYPHLLPSADSLVEWVKGSLLTYYQGHLSPELYDAFLQRYRERILAHFGVKEPMFLPFKRILLWARC